MSYRLSWWEEPSDMTGLPPRRDPFHQWIEAEDPTALGEYVCSLGWPEARAVLVEQIVLEETVASVLTMAIEVKLWDPVKHPMPRPSAGISAPRYPTVDRIRFLRDLRRLIDTAVQHEILSKNDGSKLLLIADGQTDFSK